jgi:putative ABC transport system substrate-binding protein
MPVAAFLSALSQAQTSHLVAAWKRGLSETGYVDGKNVAIEYRFADGQYDRLPALAAELVRRPVALIVAASPPAALAAKAATTTVPIVFVVGLDPVAAGLVKLSSLIEWLAVFSPPICPSSSRRSLRWW